jgi:flagellar protein FlaG
MAQNSITPIQPLVSTASPITPPAIPTTEARALNRSVSAAVQTLNDAGYAGDGREVTFAVDQTTKRPVIQVVDTSTKEVLQQWPPEYLLQVAADAEKLTRDSG